MPDQPGADLLEVVLSASEILAREMGMWEQVGRGGGSFSWAGETGTREAEKKWQQKASAMSVGSCKRPLRLRMGGIHDTVQPLCQQAAIHKCMKVA